MNLKEIIEATLIELDRGTEESTIDMYAKKFTVFANEAVDEIARRFKVCISEPTQLQGDPYPGFDMTSSDVSHACKRIVKVMPATRVSLGGLSFRFDVDFTARPYDFKQFVHGQPYIHVIDRHAKAGDYVMVEYLYVPTPMSADSLNALAPDTIDSPDLPEYLHALIPLYVRAREQCGQDPTTQGTSSAYFGLFNQKVYQLQRETMATPDSFKFIGYHFD